LIETHNETIKLSLLLFLPLGI